jgi:quercetin dioxygenase-like cupin family protein
MSTQTGQTITNVTKRGGESYQIGPELVTLKVLTAESGGRYLVIEVTTPPGGGPPIHTHPSDEVFFVVEGEFEFPTIRDGEIQAVKGSAGESVHIPGSAPHTYRNVGNDYGTLIGVLAPGGEMEGFFKEGGVLYTEMPKRPGLDAQPDFPRMMAAAQKYKVEFLVLDED